MADDFDPYHQWLGIPPQDQPPNHYRLLGLRLGESDPQVIADAAQWQAVIVGTCESGPHGDHVPRLLQELAAAQACLLDPVARSAYDVKLRAGSGFRLRSLFPAWLFHDYIVGGVGLLVLVLVAMLVMEILTRDRSTPDAVAGSRDARAVEQLAPPSNPNPPVAPSEGTVRRSDSSSPIDLTPVAERIFGAKGGPNQSHGQLADTAPSNGPPLEELLLRWQLKLAPPRETREPPEVAQARHALAQNPQDRISRSTLGRYDCFVKGDWDSGLPHLLSCSDRDLAELARQDATQPRLPGEMVKLADAWYAWGRNAGEVAKQGAWFRAITWYRKAAPRLPKPATQQIEQRIAEMAAVVGNAGLVPTVRSPWLDIPPGEVRPSAGHEDNMTALAVAPSGVLLASAAEDRTVRMWNLLTGEQIWKQETKTSHLTGVVITPDLQFVVSNVDANIDTKPFAEMQAGDGRVRRYVGHSPTSPIGLCLTPEGTIRAAAALADREITRIAFLPDPRGLVSGATAGKIRLWRLAD